MLTYAIDFGTSNSLLAAADGDRVHDPIPLDPDAKAPEILRSIMFFPTMKQVYYGARAIREFAAHDMEGRLIRSIKKFLPMRSFVGTFVEDRPLNLEDIIAVFLGELRRRADAHFGRECDRVVLGRPARFAASDEDDAFAQYRLEKAARKAGFNHVAFLAEPVAAAHAFRAALPGGGGAVNLLVADFGGGTSDFTVMRFGRAEEAPATLSVGGVSVAGDALDGAVMRRRIAPHFGAGVSYRVPFGSNDLTMPTHLMEKLCSPADISLLRKRDTLEFLRNVRTWSLGPEDKRRMDQLFTLLDNQLGFPVFEEIEATKRRLSAGARTDFRYEYPSVDITETVSRAQFDEIIGDKVEAITRSLDDTVARAGLGFEAIDLVCCTGGTARVPAIREAIVRRFGEAKVTDFNHHESVVQGLARYAQTLG